MDVKQFSSDKILKHLDRVSAWMDGKNPAPITVEMDMTNRCNHRCPECVAGYFQRTSVNSLSKEMAEDIIRQLADFKVRGLIFTGGGDPLCSKYTLETVELAKSLGLDVGFITNGTLLTKHACEVLAKNCVWVRVSLDASDPETYKITHGLNEAGFEKVLKNIKTLAATKKRLKSDCTVGVGYLTNDHTKDGMIRAAELCGDLGVDYIQYRPMQIHRGGMFDYHWTDVSQIINKCTKFGKPGYDVLFSQHKYEMMKMKDYGRNYRVCYGHQFATTICADGKMYLCCHLRGYDKYCIGDLHNNSFKEIWNSKQRKKAYESIEFKDCIPLCRDNTFNQVLWNLKQPRTHVNFL